MCVQDPQIQFILSNSVPAGMLNLGISTSGTSYTLADPTSTDVVAAATGAGAAGSLMKQEGVLAYFEVSTVFPEKKNRVPETRAEQDSKTSL